MYIKPPFSSFVASPLPTRNITMPSITLSSYPPCISTVKPSSVTFDGGLNETKWWPGIWHWWITVFFSYTLLSILPLTSVLFCVSDIANGNETGSPYAFLGDSLDLRGTIIYRSNFSPMSPLTKALLLFIIGELFVFRKSHKKMVLHASPSPIAKETITGCPFTTKGFL